MVTYWGVAADSNLHIVGSLAGVKCAAGSAADGGLCTVRSGEDNLLLRDLELIVTYCWICRIGS